MCLCVCGVGGGEGECAERGRGRGESVKKSGYTLVVLLCVKMTEQLQLGADIPTSALFCRSLRLAVRTAPKPTNANLLRSIRDRWYLKLRRNHYWAPRCEFVVMITRTPAHQYLQSVNQRWDRPKINNHKFCFNAKLLLASTQKSEGELLNSKSITSIFCLCELKPDVCAHLSLPKGNQHSFSE